MAWTLEDAKALHGLTVVDAEADRIGRLEDVYLDRRTGEAEWATVRTGRFGTKLSFVPIRDAHTNPAGDIVVQVDKDQVKHAPRIEPGEVLTPEQERALHEYYGRSDYDEWEGEDHTTDLDLPEEAPPVVVVRLRRVVVLAEAPRR